MDHPELPSHWRNAKVVKRGADPREYHRTGSDFERGDPRFIMSNGHINAFAACPAKWRAGIAAEEKNWAMDFGSWFDCLFLSPQLADTAFAVTPEKYPATPKRKDDPPEEKPWTRQANFCKEWELDRVKEGKQVIKSDIDAEVRSAMESAKADADVWKLCEDSDHQVFCVAEWHDKETELVIPVKTLLDLVPNLGTPHEKVLFDIKTTGYGSPAAWSRQLFDKGYHVQGALYTDIYAAATGEDRNTFAHIVVENQPPYHIPKPLMALDADFISLGQLKYRTALAQYCRCLKSNEWPSYPIMPGSFTYGGFQFLSPKPWQINEG